jgi:hypothetical protein
MEENVVAKPLFNVEEAIVVRPITEVKESAAHKPLLAGVIYGEIVFWLMLSSMVIAIPGLIIYIRSGGYLDSVNLLNHLWRGSDCLTIWQEVGNVSQPIPWYSCLGMLAHGDMVAVLGLVITGIAAVIGMWGAFLGTLHSKSGIFMIFAFIIAVILTLSAAGVLNLQM